MEEELLRIKNKMNNLEEKYPNLIEMWKKYIRVKKESLENGIEECEKALRIIEMSNHDLNKETITFLYLLSNTI
jgi:hypothetical protein